MQYVLLPLMPTTTYYYNIDDNNNTLNTIASPCTRFIIIIEIWWVHNACLCYTAVTHCTRLCVLRSLCSDDHCKIFSKRIHMPLYFVVFYMHADSLFSVCIFQYSYLNIFLWKPTFQIFCIYTRFRQHLFLVLVYMTHFIFIQLIIILTIYNCKNLNVISLMHSYILLQFLLYIQIIDFEFFY